MLKSKKLWMWMIIGFLAVVVIGVAVWFFGFHLPRQRAHEEHKRQVAAYTNAKLTQYEEENAKYDDYEVDVAFLGDSLTDGYDVAAYYPQYLVSNRGIGGDTTFTLEDRLQVSVYDLKPKVAVLLIGANNLQSMFDNYEDILLGFQENMPQTKVVLVSLISMSKDWGKGNELAAYNNVKIKLLADKYGYEFVDLYSPLFDLQTGEMYEQYSEDGAHQTPEGYEVFTAQITPALERLLGPGNTGIDNEETT